MNLFLPIILKKSVFQNIFFLKSHFLTLKSCECSIVIIFLILMIIAQPKNELCFIENFLEAFPIVLCHLEKERKEKQCLVSLLFNA